MDNALRNPESSIERPLPQERSDAHSSRFSRFTREAKLFYETTIRERILLRRERERFFSTLGGHIFFQTLASGVELGVFELLAKNGPLSEEEIARSVGIERQPCRILLLGLHTLGVVKKRSGRFRNSRLAKRYLLERSPWRFVDCVRWQQQINYRALAHFPEALRKNTNVGLMEIPGVEPTLYGRLSHQPALEAVFQGAMQELSRLSNDQLARFVDFRAARRIVDVGGGNGTNVRHIVEANEHLEGVVFDLPSICEHARRNFERSPAASRLSAEPGDIFRDPLPRNVDCFLFCHFFTIWSLEENLVLLRKAFDALPSGGETLIFNMMQNDDGSGPLTAAIGSPYFLTLATGRGMLYSWKEYEELFRRAGYVEIRRKRLPHDHGVLIGRKP